MPPPSQHDGTVSLRPAASFLGSPTIMPPLLRLPPEIFGYITRDLELHDLRRFRLACRDVNRAVMPTFSRKGFNRVCVMLHQRSLEILVAISRHPDFGPAVKTLAITLEHWPRHPHIKEASKVVRHQQAYSVILEDQELLAESGLGTAYLAQAMAALPSLKTVSIGGWGRPVGIDAATRQMGVYPVGSWSERANTKLMMHAVRSIVLVLFASRSTSVDELLFHDCDMHPEMLAFPPAAQRHMQASPLSSSLSYLLLEIESAERERETMSNLPDFVALFSGLQRLTLKFPGSERESNGFSEFARTVRVQGLRFLQIQDVNCTEGDLLELMRRHKGSLEEARFLAVEIAAECGNWKQLLTAVRDEALVRVLGIDSCRDGDHDEHIGFRQSCGTGIEYLEDVIIGEGGGESWTRAIDGIRSLSEERAERRARARGLRRSGPVLRPRRAWETPERYL